MIYRKTLKEFLNSNEYYPGYIEYIVANKWYIRFSMNNEIHEICSRTNEIFKITYNEFIATLKIHKISENNIDEKHIKSWKLKNEI